MNKLVMGMPIYGRGFKVNNTEENGLYCPAMDGNFLIYTFLVLKIINCLINNFPLKHLGNIEIFLTFVII